MSVSTLIKFVTAQPESGLGLSQALSDGFVQNAKAQSNRLAEYDDQRLAEVALQFRRSLFSRHIADQARSLNEDQWLTSLALAIDAVRRTMGFILHDVQVKAAAATAAGNIIEMQTGEGKTIVCGVASFLRSLIDESVHVATTNAYLAQRDYEAVLPVFKILGTSSAFISDQCDDDTKRVAYRQNIVYGPGYLFGFDYLRDQLKLRKAEEQTLGRELLQTLDQVQQEDLLTQHKHQTIIVDEADSVLIDESTTPLILSGPSTDSNANEKTFGYVHAKSVAAKMESGQHYEVDEQEKRIELTADGGEFIHQELRRLGKFYLCLPWPNYIKNAIYAEHFLKRDEHYVVQEGEIRLVDQFTGRIFSDRTLQKGLHQAVEVKEDLTINLPNETLAQITRQRFFQLYDDVVGMTGTATSSTKELKFFYQADVVPLPPNISCKRIQYPTQFFATTEDKLLAIAEDVLRRHATGQPILIGTRTIDECRLVYEQLTEIGLEAVVLNGVQDEDEAEIIEKAGQLNTLTIATNMAGRGTDIKLSEQSRDAGGLHVIGTQCYESPRIDRQLAGRSARQGDPGSCQFFVAADDELLIRHAPKLADKIAKRAAKPSAAAGLAREVAKLQLKIEAEKFQMRRSLVEQDKWKDKVRYTLAGVAK